MKRHQLQESSTLFRLGRDSGLYVSVSVMKSDVDAVVAVPLYGGGDKSGTKVECGLGDLCWQFADKRKHVGVQDRSQASAPIS